MTSTRTALVTRLRQLRRRRHDERGAYAILVSMMMLMVMALAAIAVDIASQVESKQRLKDTMDAAAHAAAFELPDGVANVNTVVRNVARATDPSSTPTVDTWCVVAALPTGQPNSDQIPSTCSPGNRKPYTAATYPGTKCSETHCFIPCDPKVAGAKCNTVRVADQKTVPYKFAPAIGFDEGSTGSVISVACKGSCGTETPNPMDIVIMADRTTSMPSTELALMKSAIEDSLKVMNPKLHYVALGTLHKSESRKIKSGDLAACATHESGVKQSVDKWGSLRWNSNNTPVLETVNDFYAGKWVPVPFSNTYLTSSETPTINTNDNLVKSIRCMPSASKGGYGTALAASLKGAARYLLNFDTAIPNNLNSLPARTNMGTPKKVIIFETDGGPDTVNSVGYIGLKNKKNGQLDFGAGRAGTAGKQGCSEFVDMAKEVKNEGVLIITIGFGGAKDGRCVPGDNKTRLVRDVLAEVASPTSDGVASKASDCSKQADRVTENSDGDFFFCAATGAELENIFRSALTSLSGGVKLMKMPA